MKLKVLGCFGGQLPGKHNSGFLLNGDTMIDAGTIGLNSTIPEQRKIKQLLITHVHADHIEGIPFYAVNVVSSKGPTVPIVGTASTTNAIKKHLLNGLIWPDFTKIKNFGGNPIFSYKTIAAGKWVNIGGYKVKAVKVNHTVPTNGYLIGKNSKYIMYSGDTKRTTKIWEEARKLGKKLKSVIVEISFPNNLAGLADASAHLVPNTLHMELKKLGKLRPKIFVYHIKPEYTGSVRRELKKIKDFNICVLEEKKTYTV